jgi:ketosteroid isomerase-like protein
MSTANSATPRPEDIAPAFDSALNRGDLDSLMALFHPEATMRMTDGSIIAEDLGVLREALAGLIAARPTIHNRVRRVLASDDIALLLLDWEIRIGETTDRGTATQIAERNADGNWQLRVSNPLGIE